MAEPFNIERFMEASGKVDLSDIVWSDVPKHPMTPEALRTLRYFLLTEGSTFFYTKALMKTRAAYRETELAPFLCVWMYEEEFHGRAFRKFIEAYGETVPSTYRTDMFKNRGAGERVDEIGQTVLSAVFPSGWPAVHMVWGAIQEFTTYTAYQRLIERVNHPILNVICQRIMKQELRHYAFYNAQAKRRLAASESARRLATHALKLAWTPVGDGMCKKEDSCHAIRFLFDGIDGDAIPLIEKKVRELPGLEWFDLFTKFAVTHDLHTPPTSWMPRARAPQQQPSVAAADAE
jgi:rubrerythrin